MFISSKKKNTFFHFASYFKSFKELLLLRPPSKIQTRSRPVYPASAYAEPLTNWKKPTVFSFWRSLPAVSQRQPRRSGSFLWTSRILSTIWFTYLPFFSVSAFVSAHTSPRGQSPTARRVP
ncbi:hypothetical protein EVAR_27374_1 [Eumeta japonica]|uniref:Uncharacterized protein n=1 Tax=Eumeta variegata TaxID=151549 RepID=A0A4C1X0T5_EUMVA|nr:hypothetical protein EVAR_27374_1 [Eumeta japonica]